VQYATTRVLTDRGITQAIAAGLLRFYPPLDDEQRQPASIDVRAESLDDLFPIEEALSGGSSTLPHARSLHEAYDLQENGRIVIPSGYEATIACTQSFSCVPQLRTRTELRSSLRRLSCYAPSGITMAARSRALVELKNPGPIDIALTPGDKIAQLLCSFTYDPGGMVLAGAVGQTDDEAAAAYRGLLACEHGFEVRTNREARNLVYRGHLQVTPRPHFEGRFLVVHAGKTARVLRKNMRVDFGAKTAIADAFEAVRLPYTVRPGEHIVVDTQEHLTLSPHVGIQFYDRLIGTSRGPTMRQSPARVVATPCSIPDGWIDPGYSGTFSRQPKTYYAPGETIRTGDVLGHGLLFSFPTAVARPYGSAGLVSHYQRQRETIIVSS
jgi:deoxycytidine triphosphate deaminase